jgi:ankyrin repeat protein
LSAAEQGLTAELTRLLAMRAGTGGALVVQVNDRDEFGRTALHVAARHGHLDAVKLLAETHGADLNAVTLPHPEGPQQPSGAAANDGDNEGSLGRKTPLHMALEAKRFEVAHYLLAKGATARAPPVAGEPSASTTALHLAAANCPTEGDASTIKTFTGTPEERLNKGLVAFCRFRSFLRSFRWC